MKKGFAASSRIRMPAGAFGLLLALVLVAAMVVPALAQLLTPMTLFGSVTTSGENVAPGTQVYAVRDGAVVEIGVVDSNGGVGGGYGGEAEFQINGEAANVDQAVTFFIGGTPGTGVGGALATTDPAGVTFQSGTISVDLMLGAAPPMNTLTVASTAGGNVTDPGEGNTSHTPGAVVALLAVPDAGFYFVNWTGDTGTIADVNAASTTITMDADYSITANFAAQLVLTTASGAGGNVTNPGEGSTSHDPGAVVALLAVPDAGFCFAGWTGDTGTIADVNAASTTITMNGDSSITATFVPEVVLTTASGAGGSVTTPGEGDNSYCPGTVVPIVATPDVGFAFVNWTGANGTIANPLAASTTITMDASHAVTANFTFIGTVELTVSSSAGGSVTTPPEAGTPSTHTVGEVVALVATPEAGFDFVNWTGDAVANANAASTTITMDADRAVQANFEETAAPTFTLTVTSGGLGEVTTPGEGVFTYDEGTVVPLVASPDAGRLFSSWTANVANPASATTTITMNQDETVIATFRTSGGGGGGGGGYIPQPTASPTPEPTSEPSSTPEPSETPAATPPPPPSDEIIDLSGSIGGDGVVTGDVSHTGLDGSVGVQVGSGTTALTAGGDPLPEITISEVCFGFPPAPANAYVVGCAYDFGPDGATFDPPITITLAYDEGNLPAGVAEEDLVIAFYDVSAGEWVVLPSTVDTVNNVITAQASHFSHFAVYAEADAQPTPTEAPTPTVAPTEAPSPTPEPDDEGGSSVGAIVGGIIGAIIVILIIVVVIRRRGASE